MYMIKTGDVAGEDYPYVEEDRWAETLLISLPDSHRQYPPLDREPIGYDSAKRVHLVLFGRSQQVESLAMYAALVAHYPNYNRDNRLRTRITIIDPEAEWISNLFNQQYAQLMQESFWRVVDLREPGNSRFHEPQYYQQRGDYVAVEWEFVVGDEYHPVVLDRLRRWSSDPRQLLTIALCMDSEEQNLSCALNLPEEVYDNGVTVYLRGSGPSGGEGCRLGGRYNNVCLFGGEGMEPDDRGKALSALGMRVNYVYHCCYNYQMQVPIEMSQQEMEKQWAAVPSLAKKYSSIFNAMTLTTKMRSLGHDEGDWNTFWCLTETEIMQLARVEHNRWCVEELLLGYRPPTDEELRQHTKRELKARMIHTDLCRYDSLKADDTGQNVQAYDIALSRAIPLIVNSYAKGGEK